MLPQCESLKRDPGTAQVTFSNLQHDHWSDQDGNRRHISMLTFLVDCMQRSYALYAYIKLQSAVITQPSEYFKRPNGSMRLCSTFLAFFRQWWPSQIPWLKQLLTVRGTLRLGGAKYLSR